MPDDTSVGRLVARRSPTRAINIMEPSLLVIYRRTIHYRPLLAGTRGKTPSNYVALRRPPRASPRTPRTPRSTYRVDFFLASLLRTGYLRYVWPDVSHIIRTA